MDGDPVPRSTTDELLAQVRDELRTLNQRAESDRGAGELREPAESPKRAAGKAARKSAQSKEV
jgi:hypothetical protein